jgi:hypothetical protein
VMEYYSNLDLPLDTKRHKDEWKKALEQLDALKAWRPEQAIPEQPAAK